MKVGTLKLLSRLGAHAISIIFGNEKDQETIFQGQTIQFDLWCFCISDYVITKLLRTIKTYYSEVTSNIGNKYI